MNRPELSGERLEAARQELQLPVVELWFTYFGIGGKRQLAELTAYLHGEQAWTQRDHNYVAVALNEHYLELGMDHPLRYLGDEER